MKALFSNRKKGLDVLAGLIVCVVSFAVYLYTVAPSVTLQDSGEEMTAAVQFGVPHPPGYPEWTFLAWLFHLLPIGNAAWKVNLFSGVCGALAVGCAAGLICNSIRWIFGSDEPGEEEPAIAQVAFVIAVTFGLALAFSVSMWSQAVVTEIYTLHSLNVVLYFTALYTWIKDPARLGRLVLVAFLFAWGMSNHHLMVSLAILPPFAVALLRRDFLAEFLVFVASVAGVVYLGFAKLSEDWLTWNNAVRVLWCCLAGLIVLFWVKRALVHWRIGLCMLLVVPLGLLPYSYMPFASSTNPPMNWGYARDPEGFFYAINRSQYQGPLSNQLLRTVGKAMGAAPPDQAWQQQRENPNQGAPQTHHLKDIMNFAGFYWIQLFRSFSIVPILGFLGAACMMFLRQRNKRAWIYVLFIGFFIAAFMQPYLEPPGIDIMGWDLQMKYHGYVYLIFTLLCAAGFAFLFIGLRRRLRFSPRWIWLLLALPVYGFAHNWPEASQRGHWFGWQYGHDMLVDLPKGSIVFGGTDPGRFVPTYMIFGESPQPAAVKRDPQFDRRDLFMLTQNTLVDPFYLKYLRDQYSPDRITKYNRFQKWLGRDTIYPKDTMIMPSDKDMTDIIKKLVQGEQAAGQQIDTGPLNSLVAQWIFEHNKDKRQVFVQESFPMEWSYPYAVPEGLIYRINDQPLDKLPADVIEKDRQFWKKYTADLLANPLYGEDIHAQMSFSKLRTAIANIYNYRGLDAEAEAAYRQALALWPANPEALAPLLQLLTNQKRLDEAVALVNASYPLDPNSPMIQQLTGLTYLRKQLQGEIDSATAALHGDPRNRDLIRGLLQDYERIGDTNAADELISHSREALPDDTVILQDFINHYVELMRFDKALEYAREWDRLDPDNAEVKYMLTKFLFATGAREEFYANMAKAVSLGGVPMRERYALDPVFGPIRGEEDFKALTRTNFDARRVDIK